jgi:UDPglucose 6-dehydrogenase
MTYVIAGYGFVGQAYFSVFKNYHKFTIVDPLHTNCKLEEVESITGVICCVSTPADNNGACDISSVLDVISKTPAHVPILIKSTIDLNGWNKIKKLFPQHKIAFSPEFLKATSAITDLVNTKSVILSGSGISFWREFFKSQNKKTKFHVYSVEEAILIKYFRNAFLATKVSFFNEIYDFCEKHNIDFDCVREGIAMDNRIGDSHTFVDPEYSRGWGGYCFPKDTSALTKMAQEKKVSLTVLESAVNYNKKIRNAD